MDIPSRTLKPMLVQSMEGVGGGGKGGILVVCIF